MTGFCKTIATPRFQRLVLQYILNTSIPVISDGNTTSLPRTQWLVLQYHLYNSIPMTSSGNTKGHRVVLYYIAHVYRLINDVMGCIEYKLPEVWQR